jgi:tetratricopeptide (TPR) repeat protein
MQPVRAIAVMQGAARSFQAARQGGVKNRPRRHETWKRLFAGALLAALVLATLPRATCAASISEARVLLNSGKYTECIELCTKGIEDYSWYETWRHCKIDAQIAVGEYSEALATMEAALKGFPSSLRLRLVARTLYLHNDRPKDAQRMLDEIDGLIREAHWRYNSSADQVTLGRYFLLRGVDAREVLEVFFDRVKERTPAYVEAYLATGEMALAKHDYAVAAEAYQQAAKIAPDDPQVPYGLARSYAPSDPDAAKAALAKALALNPRHAESLLMVADGLVDSERYREARETLEQVLEVNPRHPEACAFLAVLAHLEGEMASEKSWRGKALSSWPANPAVDHLMGRKLSQEYRFAEGAAHQRQALRFDPQYLPAKIQLSQDLLRLGEEDEGWRLATEVYEKDGYNVVAHNLVTLRETLGKFKTLQADGFRLRMEAREADIYGHAVLDLLREARQVLCAKYDVALDGTVAVEIFNEQKDFAVRTFGMPGAAGFLGVCFGDVITANSPASQGASPPNWKATLWHEFCHVVTLHKTRNKMPRWLSEGISVYEERQANAAWGQSMDARYRRMILEGELTPVSRLSGAFLEPPSPLHLQFAYYESSLVVEHLVEQHGLETLKKILDDLAADTPINVALDRHAGSLQALDEQFAEFARKRAQSLAGGADWEMPELPPDATVEALIEWNGQHPNNLAGLQALAAKLISEHRWQDAKKPLEELIRLYPENTSADNAYRLLAEVHRELGEAEAERSALEALAAIDGDAADVYIRLMDLCEEAEDWEGVARNTERTLAVNPLIRAPYRCLAAAAERLDMPERAIQAYRALIRLDPMDPAETHFRLARVLKGQGDLTGARRHVLMALEEAPRFRAAHRLLLDLVEQRADEAAEFRSPEMSRKDPP